MDVGSGELAAGGPNRPDRRTFHDRALALDSNRPQVHERDRVSIVGLDRHRKPIGRHAARERDDAATRREDRFAARTSDGDASVLATGIGVAAEMELLQDIA
jgi:hypothetical protein